MIPREFTHSEESYDNGVTLCIFGKYSEHRGRSEGSSTYSQRDVARHDTTHRDLIHCGTTWHYATWIDTRRLGLDATRRDLTPSDLDSTWRDLTLSGEELTRRGETWQDVARLDATRRVGRNMALGARRGSGALALVNVRRRGQELVGPLVVNERFHRVRVLGQLWLLAQQGLVFVAGLLSLKIKQNIHRYFILGCKLINLTLGMRGERICKGLTSLLWYFEY